VFDMKDSYRAMYPKVKGQGATQIDTQYYFGNITIKEAEYFPLTFSDHYGLVFTICLPEPLARILCPKGGLLSN
jgi:hypothetical protein